MKGSDIMGYAKPSVSDAAIRAMEEQTLTVYDPATFKTIAMVVRNINLKEDDDRFFMDYAWLAWFEATHPNLAVTGSMTDLTFDTDGEFLWFVAVRSR